MSHLRCVYIESWKPAAENRGAPCSAALASGATVPLCPAHAALTCAVCGTAATRRYQGKDLCPKAACGS